jgi:CHAT domain-containing protein
MKLVVRRVSLLLAVLQLLATASCKPTQEPAAIPTAEPNALRAASVNPTPLEIAFGRGNLTEVVPVIEQTWEKQYAEYFRRSFPDASITAKDVADTLTRIATQTGTKPALIYVVPQKQHLELVLITPGNQPIHKRVSAANKEALLQQVKELSKTVTDPDQRNTTNYLPPAQQLYQWMVAPLEPELQAQGIDTLIFCMGTGLRTLPLAVLQDGQKFLVEKYSSTRIPAFKLTDTIYGDLRNSQVLAMGASEFKEQQPLPAVPVELSAIAQDLWQGKSFLNQEFTQTNLRQQRQQTPFKIIHLATPTSSPENPAILTFNFGTAS